MAFAHERREPFQGVLTDRVEHDIEIGVNQLANDFGEVRPRRGTQNLVWCVTSSKLPWVPNRLWSSTGLAHIAGAAGGAGGEAG